MYLPSRMQRKKGLFWRRYRIAAMAKKWGLGKMAKTLFWI